MNIKQETVVKPVVKFLWFDSFNLYFGGIRSATMHGVHGHPRLGYQHTVHTSEVMSVDDEENPTLIETRNTIYKKVSAMLVDEGE